jgi:hypothetical protein
MSTQVRLEIRNENDESKYFEMALFCRKMQRCKIATPRIIRSQSGELNRYLYVVLVFFDREAIQQIVCLM